MAGPVTPPLADVHAHFLTDDYVAAARAGGHEHPDGMPRWPRYSADDHLRQLDQNDVGRALLSISSPGVHFGDDAAAADLARHVNQAGAALRSAHPDRFGLFASLPVPDVAGAQAELRYARDELGADGITLESNAHGVYLGDPRYAPLLADLNSSGTIVFLHPTSPPGSEAVALGRPRPMLEFLFDTARTVSDLLLSGAFARYPRIRWVVPHGGGVLPLLADRLDLFRRGLLGDGGDPRDSREILAGLWYDTAGTPFPHQLPVLTELVGEDQVVYGSDSCWTPEAGVAQTLASLDAVKRADGVPWRDVLARNAAQLLSAP
jgi:predicted TIM-barrel fold metal-dependent hydrolase